jgi:hypothetical protein
VIGVDLEKVIPDRSLTLAERPVAPWNTPAYESAYADLFRACRRYSVRTDVPVARLSAHEREVLLAGRGDFYGVKGFFDWLETKRYKIHVRVLLARYRAYTMCDACRGARLAPPALWVRWRGRTIAELSELPLSDLRRFVETMELTPSEQERLGSVVAELSSRVRYMNDVGLGYLTLSRAARTLSGGEAQRIGLASALGGSLTGTLYVLDEPTIGLHAADTRRLLGILRRLADRGNTVVVVEHDPEIIEAADHLVDLGPGAGREGGRLLFQGAPRSLARVKDSATGELLRRRGRVAPRAAGEPGEPRPGPDAGAPARRARVVPARSGSDRPLPPRRGRRHHRRRARAQPEEPDRADPARQVGRGRRCIRVGQVDPRPRHPSQHLRAPDQGNAVVRRRRSRAHRRIRVDLRSPARRPEPARTLRALEPRDLHEGVGRDPHAVRSLRPRRRERRVGGRLLLQRAGRPLRGVPRHRLADDRHAVPGGRHGPLRRLRRPPLPGEGAVNPGAREEHRRRPGDDDRPGVRLLLRRGEDRAQTRAAARGRGSATCGSASRPRRCRAARRSA